MEWEVFKESEKERRERGRREVDRDRDRDRERERWEKEKEIHREKDGSVVEQHGNHSYFPNTESELRRRVLRRRRAASNQHFTNTEICILAFGSLSSLSSL